MDNPDRAVGSAGDPSGTGSGVGQLIRRSSPCSFRSCTARRTCSIRRLAGPDTALSTVSTAPTTTTRSYIPFEGLSLQRGTVRITRWTAAGRSDLVGILSKLFGRNRDDDEEPAPIVLDAERRKPQLIRLEKALDALATDMRANSTMDNPGWRGRVNEYSRLAGETWQLRRGELSRDAVLDLVFEIRPVFSGPDTGRNGIHQAPPGRGDGRRRGPPRTPPRRARLTLDAASGPRRYDRRAPSSERARAKPTPRQTGRCVNPHEDPTRA